MTTLPPPPSAIQFAISRRISNMPTAFIRMDSAKFSMGSVYPCMGLPTALLTNTWSRPNLFRISSRRASTDSWSAWSTRRAWTSRPFSRNSPATFSPASRFREAVITVPSASANPSTIHRPYMPAPPETSTVLSLRLKRSLTCIFASPRRDCIPASAVWQTRPQRRNCEITNADIQ